MNPKELLMPLSVAKGLLCAEDEVNYYGTGDFRVKLSNHCPAERFPAFRMFVERDGMTQFAFTVRQILVTIGRELEETDKIIDWGYVLNRYDSAALVVAICSGCGSKATWAATARAERKRLLGGPDWIMELRERQHWLDPDER